MADKVTGSPNGEGPFQLLTEDGGLKKRITKEGEGPLPAHGATLKVHYVGTLHLDDITFDSSRDRDVPFTFKLGEGQVIKGWDEGVKTMKVGEVAELICSPEYAYRNRGFPPLIPENATLKFEIELLDFTNKPIIAKPPAQKIREATKKKEEGNEQFNKGSFNLALPLYTKGKELISDMWDCTMEERTESRNLVIALGTNIAACHLKLGEWSAAVKACDEVLDRDPKNVKAFYRLGQAHLNQSEYEQGIAEIRKGLRIAPNDVNLKSMLASLTKKQAEFKKKEKSMYANMFK